MLKLRPQSKQPNNAFNQQIQEDPDDKMGDCQNTNVNNSNYDSIDTITLSNVQSTHMENSTNDHPNKVTTAACECEKRNGIKGQTNYTSGGVTTDTTNRGTYCSGDVKTESKDSQCLYPTIKINSVSLCTGGIKYRTSGKTAIEDMIKDSIIQTRNKVRDGVEPSVYDLFRDDIPVARYDNGSECDDKESGKDLLPTDRSQTNGNTEKWQTGEDTPMSEGGWVSDEDLHCNDEEPVASQSGDDEDGESKGCTGGGVYAGESPDDEIFPHAITYPQCETYNPSNYYRNSNMNAYYIDEDEEDMYNYLSGFWLATGFGYKLPGKMPQTIAQTVKFWENDFQVGEAIFPKMSSWERKGIVPDAEEEPLDYRKYCMIKTLYVKWLDCSRSEDVWFRKYWGLHLSSIVTLENKRNKHYPFGHPKYKSELGRKTKHTDNTVYISRKKKKKGTFM